MGLRSICEVCNTDGVAFLKKVNGKYLCKLCVENPSGKLRYYCNSCEAPKPNALMKGNGWIEFVLYFCALWPGVMYSLWRRIGPLNVCVDCRSAKLVPAHVKKHTPVGSKEIRDEIDCPHCAEKILARANVCKHCGTTVRVVLTPKPLSA
jgi:DNA-directed RNA polymerase subunit RPC12/RpoP